MAVNYGLNRVRFPAPVPVGSQIRLHAQVADVEEVARRRAADRRSSPSRSDGADKPAVVAEAVYRYYA